MQEVKIRAKTLRHPEGGGLRSKAFLKGDVPPPPCSFPPEAAVCLGRWVTVARAVTAGRIVHGTSTSAVLGHPGAQLSRVTEAECGL
jgi:hypothetical protein